MKRSVIIFILITTLAIGLFSEQMMNLGGYCSINHRFLDIDEKLMRITSIERSMAHSQPVSIRVKGLLVTKIPPKNITDLYSRIDCRITNSWNGANVKFWHPFFESEDDSPEACCFPVPNFYDNLAGAAHPLVCFETFPVDDGSDKGKVITIVSRHGYLSNCGDFFSSGWKR